MHNPAHIAVGTRFGRWTTIGTVVHGKHPTVPCRCDCGSVKKVQSGNLITGKSTNCGCIRKQVLLASVTTHGLSYTAEYKSWAQAKQRTTNPNNSDFALYGGRGISMCERWLNDVQSFYADMGRCPEGMSLDRIDVDGNYEPGNCRWATQLEQVHNRRPILSCRKGHPYEVGSYWVSALGKKSCKECARIRAQSYRPRRNELYRQKRNAAA